MKPLSFGPVKNWFGYSRRERRASFILLLLMVTVIIARYMVPERKHETEVITLESGFPEADTQKTANYVDYTGHATGKRIPVRKKQILELNTCDSAALESLPGIGPVLARRIIKYRNLLGGFVSAGQLREVYGLSDSTFDIISKRVWADSSRVARINLNTVDFKRLIRLPYLEKYDVMAILKYRELQGSIESLDVLVRHNIISREKANKIRAYMEFGKSSPPLKGAGGM
jgi:DNA uptake protein ComE-like DNA-binding protein